MVFRQIPILLASAMILAACAPPEPESDEYQEPPIPEIYLGSSRYFSIISSIWTTASTTFRFRTGDIRGLYHISLSNSSAADVGWAIVPENDGETGGAFCNTHPDSSDENCATGVLEPNQSYLIYVNNHSSFNNASGTILITFISEATLLNPDTPTSVAMEAGARHYYQIIPDDHWVVNTISITSAQSAMYGDLYSTDYNQYKSQDFTLNEHLSMNMTPGQGYILEVIEKTFQAASYEITLSRSGEVVPLTMGVSASGTIPPYGDPLVPAKAFFKFDSKPLLTGAPGEEYFYKVSLTGVGTDVQWMARDEFFVGNPLIWCDNITGVGDEICNIIFGHADISTPQPPSSPMYLEVFHYDDVSSTPFDILVEEFPVPELATGDTANYNIGAGGFRYFKFTTEEYVGYDFKLTNTQSNLAFYFVSSYGDSMVPTFTCDNVTSGAGDEICSWPDYYQSKTLIIMVEELDGVAGTFDFTIQKVFSFN
ncbi:MAG: hypothetical protein OEZ59_06390 [Deltaproteobacteria bacterium]|nr:hypothetical protein [Deltaproteobacteria bacterium]